MSVSTVKKAQKHVHYYAQSSGFTCGPSSLMMALRKYDSGIKICRETEYQIWRESNTLYMGSGHPGTNPYGLALSAKRRGIESCVLVQDPVRLFESWNRSEEKNLFSKALIASDLLECFDTGIPVLKTPFTIETMRRFGDDVTIVILTGQARERHWMVVFDIGKDVVTVHDPWRADTSRERTESALFRKIPIESFAKMIVQGGSRKAQAAIVLGNIAPIRLLDDRKDSRRFRQESSGDLEKILKALPDNYQERQVTDFTCGPHCIALLDRRKKELSSPDVILEELRIWREANMIFAGSSLPGCGPYGLALAARRRGFKCELWVHNATSLLAEKTSDVRNRDIQIIMEGYDRSRVLNSDIEFYEEPFDLLDIEDAMKNGASVILLVNSGAYGHWILLRKISGDTVKYIDPWIHSNKLQTKSYSQFNAWLRFGRRKIQSALLLS